MRSLPFQLVRSDDRAATDQPSSHQPRRRRLAPPTLQRRPAGRLPGRDLSRARRGRVVGVAVPDADRRRRRLARPARKNEERTTTNLGSWPLAGLKPVSIYFSTFSYALAQVAIIAASIPATAGSCSSSDDSVCRSPGTHASAPPAGHHRQTRRRFRAPTPPTAPPVGPRSPAKQPHRTAPETKALC